MKIKLRRRSLCASSLFHHFYFSLTSNSALNWFELSANFFQLFTRFFNFLSSHQCTALDWKLTITSENFTANLHNRRRQINFWFHKVFTQNVHTQIAQLFTCCLHASQRLVWCWWYCQMMSLPPQEAVNISNVSTFCNKVRNKDLINNQSHTDNNERKK